MNITKKQMEKIKQYDDAVDDTYSPSEANKRKFSFLKKLFAREEVMLDEYLIFLQERLFFERKTLAFDLEDFISGKKDKLIIVGPAGSGKSTLGKKLAKKYRVKYFEGDSCWEPARKKYPDISPTDMEAFKKINEIYYKCLLKTLRTRQRMIVEGIGFLELTNGTPEERKLILEYPVILLGTSAWKSTMRTYRRSKAETDEKKKINPVLAFLYYGFVNVFAFDAMMNKYRKIKLKDKNTKVQVFTENLVS